MAVTRILTRSATTGVAPWTVDLACPFTSLFRDTNAEVLARVRDRWQRWLEAHPLGVGVAELGEEDDAAQGVDYEWEDFVVTLAEPPRGAPPDNRDLRERSAPLLRAALGRWEESLGVPFQCAITR